MKKHELKLLDNLRREKVKKEKIESSGKRMKDPNLKAISNALDEYYISQKLNIYCAFLSYSKIVNPNHIGYNASDFYLIKEIIKLVETIKISNPSIQIFNTIRKLYEKVEVQDANSEANFDYFMQLIKENRKHFSTDELEEFYAYGTNFCIRRINMADKIYIEKFFLLSNQFLGIRYGKGNKRKELPNSVFKNMVSSALMLKGSNIFSTIETEGLKPKNHNVFFSNAFEWIEAFIDYYGKRLNKEIRLSYIMYCKARMEFERGNFIVVYHLLKQTYSLRETLFGLNLKVLYLKVLLELHINSPDILEKDNIDIEKIHDAFRALIKDEKNRKKGLNYQLNYYRTFQQNYIKLFRFHIKYKGKLYNEKDEKFETEKKLLQKRIAPINHPYKDWLLKKTEEIK